MAYNRSQDHHHAPLQPPPPPSLSSLPPRPPSPFLNRGGDANSRNGNGARGDDRRGGDRGFRGPYSDLRQAPPRRDRDRDYDRDHRDYDQRGGRHGGDYRDNQHDNQRDNFRPPQGDFNFRVEAPSGLDTYRPYAQDGRGPGSDRYVFSLHRYPIVFFILLTLPAPAHSDICMCGGY